jgi:hypothetical protein
MHPHVANPIVLSHSRFFFTRGFARLSLICAFFVALPGAKWVRAEAIYDNLAAETIEADEVTQWGPLASSFSTGDSPLLLESVAVKLKLEKIAAGHTTLDLLADDSTSPGLVLQTIGTLDDALLTSAATDYGFNLTTPELLSPNTRYWLQLSSDDGALAEWAFTFDTGGPGVADQFFWNANGLQQSSDGPYQMRIAGSVPEPATAFVSILGIFFLSARSRRRGAR